MPATFTFKGQLTKKDGAQIGLTVNVLDTFAAAQSVLFEGIIEKTTTDKAISFQEITTAKRIFIQSDKPILIKLNANTNTAIPCGTGAAGAFLWFNGEITALFITNPSQEEDVNVTVVVASE